MANDEIAELTWENGQISLHEFGGIFPNGSAKAPAWDRAGDTLESVVQRATISNKEAGPSLAQRANHGVRNGGSVVASSGGRWESDQMNGLVIKKRTRSESEQQCRMKLYSEDEWADMSVCASADAAFCRDTDRTRTVCTLASHESSRSTRTKTTDDDSACNGGSENLLDGRAVRCETERFHSARKGRAAAVHNQSERRRRDRINQKMKALQKMVPNASKTDKASMLDEVIEYLKQLQTQVQLMSARSMSQHMMMPFGMQQQLQMSLLARAGMGVGLGMGMGMLNMGNVAAHASAAPQHLASLIHQTPQVTTSAPTFVAPPLLVPPSAPQQAKPDPGNSSLVPFQDPYNAFLGQSMNMEMYNRMASLYGQQMNQSPKTSSHM